MQADAARAAGRDAAHDAAARSTAEALADAQAQRRALVRASHRGSDTRELASHLTWDAGDIGSQQRTELRMSSHQVLMYGWTPFDVHPDSTVSTPPRRMTWGASAPGHWQPSGSWRSSRLRTLRRRPTYTPSNCVLHMNPASKPSEESCIVGETDLFCIHFAVGETDLCCRLCPLLLSALRLDARIRVTDGPLPSRAFKLIRLDEVGFGPVAAPASSVTRALDSSWQELEGRKPSCTLVRAGGAPRPRAGADPRPQMLRC